MMEAAVMDIDYTLSIEEAASMAELTVTRMRQLCERGDIRHCKVDGHIFVNAHFLNLWLSSRQPDRKGKAKRVPDPEPFAELWEVYVRPRYEEGDTAKLAELLEIVREAVSGIRVEDYVAEQLPATLYDALTREGLLQRYAFDFMVKPPAPAEVWVDSSTPGEILAERMREEGLTCTRFAELLGWPPNNLRMWLKSGVRISTEQALQIAKALGDKPEEWLRLVRKPTPPQPSEPAPPPTSGESSVCRSSESSLSVSGRCR